MRQQGIPDPQRPQCIPSELSSSLLGQEPEDVEPEHAVDALTELANILGGEVARILGGDLHTFTIGLPELVSEVPEVTSLTSKEHVSCKLETVGETLHVLVIRSARKQG